LALKTDYDLLQIKFLMKYVFVAVNLPRDVKDDGQGDGGQPDVDEPEVRDVTKHSLEESGERI